MLAAPPSCAAGTKRAPAAISALVTWKLPLPTTPNTQPTPWAASARPTTSATLVPVRVSLGPLISFRASLTSLVRSSPFDERERAARAAGTAHDRQRTDEEHGAGGR